MKNRFFVLVLAIILAFTIIGCSSEEPTESTEEKKTQEDTEQIVESEEINSEEENVEPAVQEVSLDSSLKGIDLFKTISDARPSNMKMKMRMESYGMTTDTILYYQGENTRTETLVEGMGNSVLIYNSDEELIYNYVEESGEGIKIVGADIESAEEAGLTMDLSTKFSGISEEISEDLIARVENLEGEEVVYIETMESDEEMGEILVKMWYSVKYNIPLKYEVSIGQQSLMSLNVSEIEKDIKFDKEIFTAPSDIIFQDVNIEDMMEMME